MRTIQLTHDYPFPASDVWNVAIDYDCLAEVMQGLIKFDGLPTGQAGLGQSISVMVSLFGRLPAQPYHMEIVEFNPDRMIMISSEQGAGVKSWHHRLQVTTTPTGSRLTDRIEIDAGWMTWPFTLWAKYLYKKRHAPRLRILDRWSHEIGDGG